MAQVGAGGHQRVRERVPLSLSLDAVTAKRHRTEKILGTLFPLYLSLAWVNLQLIFSLPILRTSAEQVSRMERKASCFVSKQSKALLHQFSLLRLPRDGHGSTDTLQQKITERPLIAEYTIF